ncbi:hypothetical protein [Shouchella miscanthi]|uniref:Lipoprotein n=1 Tax=Shouchella miscanthi TaxID=2598861 RepID=A0ABU6NPS5_9BACI|nr:hypothetical protein [Shouchella miscanthi]
MKKALSLFSIGLLSVALTACNSTNDAAQAEIESVETQNVSPVEEVEDEVEVDIEETPEVDTTEASLHLEIQDLVLSNPEIFPVQKLTGNGGGSHVFEISSNGMTAFELENTNASSNYIVRVEDVETGTDSMSLVNEIGNYSGKAIMQLDEGEYILQTQSDGDWTVTIHPAYSIEIDESTVWEGVGDSFIGPFVLSDGLYELIFSHDGNSNFIARRYDGLGNSIDSLVNEIGPYEGNHITTAYEGMVMYISIKADGNWKFELNQ